METQDGECGTCPSGAHTKLCPERLRVMSFPPEKFPMGGRPAVQFSSSGTCRPSNMKLSQFALTYFRHPPGFSHEWAWGWQQGLGGSGIRPISQVHSIPWGLNKLSNQMNMQPTLRRWEKKRDRNVSFSECLSSLSALGTGWGPMSKNVCESI